MPTQTTSLVELQHPETGDADWEVVLNALFADLDAHLAAALVKDVAGDADVTLTLDEVKGRWLELTGALTGDIEVVLPRSGLWAVHNNTSGEFSVTVVRAASGTGVVIPQGKSDTIAANATVARSVLGITPTGREFVEAANVDDLRVFLGLDVSATYASIQISDIAMGEVLIPGSGTFIMGVRARVQLSAETVIELSDVEVGDHAEIVNAGTANVLLDPAASTFDHPDFSSGDRLVLLPGDGVKLSVAEASTISFSPIL